MKIKRKGQKHKYRKYQKLHKSKDFPDKMFQKEYAISKFDTHFHFHELLYRSVLIEKKKNLERKAFEQLGPPVAGVAENKLLDAKTWFLLEAGFVCGMNLITAIFVICNFCVFTLYCQIFHRFGTFDI